MHYNPIALSPQVMPARLPRRTAADRMPLHDDDPAVTAMTDFMRDAPLTVAGDRQIDGALQDMIQGGVRALIVLRDGIVQGLITSYDIQGEKPIQFIQGPDCVHDDCRHQDVLVEDIMTRWETLPKLSVASLRAYRVGDLVATFSSHPDWMHLLVVEETPGDGCSARGIVSRTRLERGRQQSKAAA